MVVVAAKSDPPMVTTNTSTDHSDPAFPPKSEFLRMVSFSLTMVGRNGAGPNASTATPVVGILVGIVVGILVAIS